MADFTQAQLDTLRTAYAAGRLKVAFGGRVDEFASTADLEKRIATVERALAVQAGNTPVRTIRTYMNDEDDATL